MYATVPDSSINSWDSWFIFNLRKNKHLLLYEQFRRTYIHRERIKDWLWLSNWSLHYNVTTVLSYASIWLIHDNEDGFSCKFLSEFAHYLGNVHTWAISFLRHLANVSSMVPFWASTDSGFVPNLGPRLRSHAVRRRLFILLMTKAGHPQFKSAPPQLRNIADNQNDCGVAD
jgi:hypothetical protein